MERTTRRGFLAAVGSAVLAGCSSGGDGADPETVTALDVPTVRGRRTPATTTASGCPPNCERVPAPGFGPDPLGFAAIPEGSAVGPPIRRERRYDGAGGDGAPTSGSDATDTATTGEASPTTVVDIASHPAGVLALVWTGTDDGQATPRLVRVDTVGRVRWRRDLSDARWSLPTTLVRVDGVTVVGGTVTADDGQYSRVQWYREGRLAGRYEPPLGTAIRDATTLAESLVVVEGTDGEYGRLPGVDVVRLGDGGSEQWRHRLEVLPAGGDPRAIRASGDRVVATGATANGNWVVCLDAAGTERWDATLPGGRQSYRVDDLAVGPIGTYLLTRPGATWEGRDHLLVAALDRRGEMEWVRVFDPAVGEDGITRLFPSAVLDTHGPLVGGRAAGSEGDRQRPWMASLSGAGIPQWAGYHRSVVADPDESVDLWGVERLDTSVVAYGRIGDGSFFDADSSSPWLAWL